MENKNENGFSVQVRQRVKEKIQENISLNRDIQRMQRQVELNKEYIEQLNKFLEAEGEHPELTIERPTSIVGRPGNRSRNLPLRLEKWEGMSVNSILQNILDMNPKEIYTPKSVSPLIYEIHNESDLNLVVRNVRSMLQRGAQSGLWLRLSRGKFQSKTQVAN